MVKAHVCEESEKTRGQFIWWFKDRDECRVKLMTGGSTPTPTIRTLFKRAKINYVYGRVDLETGASVAYECFPRGPATYLNLKSDILVR
jgi:hypothetical protein